MNCSPFVATLNSCLICPAVSCTLNPASRHHPFGTLFQYLDSPGIFACDGSSCLWIHNNIFSQELECVAGACITDVVVPEK